MRATEFIKEGLNHPCIVVDVQPAYSNPKTENTCAEIVNFVNKQTGPVLMFVNAENDGLTADTVQDIQQYWESIVTGIDHDSNYDDPWGDEPEEQEHAINWDRFEIVDKGYGYLRAWMDQGVPPAVIIKVIRLMYQNKVNDSRELFGGHQNPLSYVKNDDYEINMQMLVGKEFINVAMNDPLIVGWASIAQLKKYSGAYIMGGGRNECLREVELLMNAFNIKYKRVDQLVYG